MTILAISRYTLTLSATAALLAGCGQSQPPLGPVRAGLDQPQSPQSRMYRVVHEFGKAAGDGTNPRAKLIVVRGTLYGTTFSGGTSNVGTVFALTKSGQETVLHSFGAPGDGSQPAAGLVDINGTLYGTTVEGGANDSGAVFSITRAGKEAVLYSFPFSANAGAQPWAGLIDVNGTLYGTTYQGGDDSCGSGGCGSVFSITPAGSERLVYSFGTHANDGENPQAALLNVGSTLYGTTENGGEYRRGTAFAISRAGKERVLYSFGKSGFHDGSFPMAGLVYDKGRLYGTTQDGGAAGEGGTVFSLTTNGTEEILHSFEGSDGSQPMAGLILLKNILYGTTLMGGVKNVGTVFSLTTSGEETVLHSFSAGGGRSPLAGLLVADGTLYGTTWGSGNQHHGNVYSLTP